MKSVFTLIAAGVLTLPCAAAVPLTLKGGGQKAPQTVPTGQPQRIVEDGWHSVGKGVWYEGLLTIFDEIDYDLSWEIDVEESDSQPGYYRFIPYHAGSPVAEIVGAADTEYFYLNASDPQKVYSEEFIAYRDFEYNYYFSQKVPENLWDVEMYGTLDDNVVYFPPKSFGYFAEETATFWDVNFEGDFKIVLPGGTAKPNWNVIGTTTFTDGFCGPYFLSGAVETEVTVEERDRRPGYYRLQGAFSPYGSTAPLIIDATNPDFVTVPYQYAGFQHPDRGEVVVYSHCENFITPAKFPTIEDYAEAFPQYVATLRDGIVTFPPDAIVLHFPDWNPLSFTTNDDAARETKVRVSGLLNAIEEVNAGGETDAPVEYYSFQGIKVDNPCEGIYIERRGNKSRKVLISK